MAGLYFVFHLIEVELKWSSPYTDWLVRHKAGKVLALDISAFVLSSFPARTWIALGYDSIWNISDDDACEAIPY